MKRPTLKSTALLLVMIAGGSLVGLGCHLWILGGPTKETTETPCADGSWCPNAYPLCPQYPGERCQADIPEIETGVAHVVDDAGMRAHAARRDGPFPVRHATGAPSARR